MVDVKDVDDMLTVPNVLRARKLKKFHKAHLEIESQIKLKIYIMFY